MICYIFLGLFPTVNHPKFGPLLLILSQLYSGCQCSEYIEIRKNSHLDLNLHPFELERSPTTETTKL